MPSSGFMNMYMYKFVIVFFPLIVFWAVNALVVLRGKPSQNERPGMARGVLLSHLESLIGST